MKFLSISMLAMQKFYFIKKSFGNFRKNYFKIGHFIGQKSPKSYSV